MLIFGDPIVTVKYGSAVSLLIFMSKCSIDISH